MTDPALADDRGGYPEESYTTPWDTIRRFQIPDSVWNAMTPDEQWAANVRFLDRTIARGDTITLSNPASSARVGTSYYKELQYFQQKGYTLSGDQMSLLPPVKK